MGHETPIVFKFFCAKCRTVLDVKDYAPCRVYDGGFNGMAVNPLPCDQCMSAAAGLAVEKFQREQKAVNEAWIKAEVEKRVAAAVQEQLAEIGRQTLKKGRRS